MSAANSLLPEGFETLASFVKCWAVTPAANRADRRVRSTEQERAEFYKVANELLPSALAYLDQKSLHQLDDKEQRLMNLVLSFVHVAYAIEVQGDGEAKHAQYAQRLRITRATADSPL